MKHVFYGILLFLITINIFLYVFHVTLTPIHSLKIINLIIYNKIIQRCIVLNIGFFYILFLITINIFTFLLIQNMFKNFFLYIILNN